LIPVCAFLEPVFFVGKADSHLSDRRRFLAHLKGDVMKRLGWLVILVGTWWICTTTHADEIDDQIKALRDPDATIRANAAAALSKVGKDALPKLKEALKKEKGKDSQLAVLQALAIVGPDPEDADLRRQLLTLLISKPDIRPEVVRVLGKLGAGSALALKNILKDKEIKDPEIKRYALLGLGYLGEDAKDQTGTIKTFLGFKNTPAIRAAAAEALGRIGPDAEGASSDLSRAAKDKDVGVRVASSVALCRIVPEEKVALNAVVALISDDAAWKAATGSVAALGPYALAFYTTALKAKDENVRFKALQGMVAMKDTDLNKEAAEAIGPSLKDESLGIRRAAVNVLNKMSPKNVKDAVPQVAEALKDKDPGIRGIALGILNKLGADAKSASPKLAELLKDKDPVLRKTVLGVLDKLGADAAPSALALLNLVAEEKDLLPDVQKMLEKFGIAALPSYLKALESENPVVKQLAADQIGKLGPAGREAAAALSVTLRDKDKAVRTASADALEKIGKGVVQTLVMLLKDPDPATRAQAIETIGELGPKAKAATPDLQKALADKDGIVRLQAALALKKLGDAKDSLTDLVKLLDDPDGRVRKIAAASLEEVGPDAKPAVPGLTRMLRSRDRAARQQAANTLKAIGMRARAAVPELTNLLMDSDMEVRTSGIQALGKIGPDARDAVPALVVLFKDKEETIRSQAATAIGDIGPTSIPILTEALRYEDKDVRQYAAIAFVNMGPKAKEALPALAAALKDKDPEVRKAVALSLKEIGPDAKPVVAALTEALTKDTENEVRIGMILILGTMAIADKPSMMAMISAFKDKDEAVRMTAIEAVSKLGAAAVPSLAEALKDKDKNSKICACVVLEKLGPGGKLALAGLMEASKSNDDDVRAAAAKALEKVNQ
jgi:HEAT repeat protein